MDRERMSGTRNEMFSMHPTEPVTQMGQMLDINYFIFVFFKNSY